MAGVPYVFGNATTSIPLTNLDANFNTGLTIGNTTVGLGNTVTTLGNVTLNNVTINSGTSNVSPTNVVATTLTIGGVALGAGNASTLKNRIINGAMVISQYNGTSSVTPTGAVYVVDRWQAIISQSSKLSFQQNAGSVTPPAGFTNYLGITSLSAYSLVTSDYFLISQKIEGFNTADLGWGTANAKTVTVSFQAYSSLTGTFGFVLRNASSARAYPASYSIPVANTWTTISVIIAGDTAGTWLTTNGIGIELDFGLGVASNSSATAGAWTTGCLGVTGATSVVGTSGATFYITGVQLEVGSSATGFEYRQYTTELSLCQRYYQILPTWSYDGYAAAFGQFGYAGFTFPVAMRAAPTVTTGTQNNGTANNGGPLSVDITSSGYSMRIESSGAGRFYYLSSTGATASIEL